MKKNEKLIMKMKRIKKRARKLALILGELRIRTSEADGNRFTVCPI